MVSAFSADLITLAGDVVLHRGQEAGDILSGRPTPLTMYLDNKLPADVVEGCLADGK
jgi:hypothetical protein